MNIFRFITVCAIALAFSGQVFAQNLITNGGFENTGNPGLGWNLLVADTGWAATVEYPTTGAAEGTTYAHVHVTKATVMNAMMDNYKVQLQLPHWVTTKNASYKLSFKARSSAVTFKVGINRGDSVGTYVNGFDITFLDGWQSYYCSFTSDTSGNGQLRLNFYVGADTGTYDFDSVTLVRLDTITAPGGNLIDNGGFESAGTGWNLLIQSGFTASMEYPSAGAPEGTTFARVKVSQVTGTDPNEYNWRAQLQLPEWTATKNGIYLLTFKVRSTATTFKVGINRPGLSGTYVNGFDIPLDTTWQTRSCMFISDTSGVGQLRLNFYIGADTGVYDFDSISLAMTGTAVPTNSVISNGGFELLGSGWNLYVQPGVGAEATVSYPTTGAPEGSKYASVNVTMTGDASQVQLQLPIFTAEKNAIYTLTYKARGAGTIEVVSQNGSPDYTPISPSLQDVSSEWTTYSQQIINDTLAGNGALRINFWIGLSTGTYDFDSVSLVKTGNASIRPIANKAGPIKALTIRKAGAGYAVTLPGLAAFKGSFSLSVYSPAGRLIKSISGVRNGNNEILLPLKNLKGTYIIRYSDENGKISKRTCLVR
jgi:Carbohydrate binding domain.